MGPKKCLNLKVKKKSIRKRASSTLASTSSVQLVDLGDSTEESNEVTSGSAKKNRSENWSKDEQLALVNSVAPAFEQLFGKHSQSLDECKKAQLWKDVSDRVNAVSKCQRPIASIKKKFIQLKSNTKGLASQIIRDKYLTGGGEKVDLTMDIIQELLVDLEFWQRSLVRMIGVEGLIGIDGGIDGPDKDKVQNHADEGEGGLIAAQDANEPDIEGTVHNKKRKKISGIEASETMIEIQANILEQMKIIAGGITELVQFVRGGGLNQPLVLQEAQFLPVQEVQELDSVYQ